MQYSMVDSELRQCYGAKQMLLLTHFAMLRFGELQRKMVWTFLARYKSWKAEPNR